MRREGSLEEISDGRLYESNDMVKADCGGCAGCSACCRGMGNTIILDPFDAYRLCTGTDLPFERLLQAQAELGVVDGIILPNLRMDGADGACAFLDESGRCGIHGYRPGICRLFPLGRYYENDGFSYFLQIHECPKEPKAKIKVKKWIDTPRLKEYERFIKDWHYFLDEIRNVIREENNQERERALCLYVLTCFYQNPYDREQDFFEQFYERLKAARNFALS